MENQTPSSMTEAPRERAIRRHFLILDLGEGWGFDGKTKDLWRVAGSSEILNFKERQPAGLSSTRNQVKLLTGTSFWNTSGGSNHQIRGIGVVSKFFLLTFRVLVWSRPPSPPPPDPPLKLRPLPHEFGLKDMRFQWCADSCWRGLSWGEIEPVMKKIRWYTYMTRI